jgi:hypothetical protein
MKETLQKLILTVTSSRIIVLVVKQADRIARIDKMRHFKNFGSEKVI